MAGRLGRGVKRHSLLPGASQNASPRLAKLVKVWLTKNAKSLFANPLAVRDSESRLKVFGKVDEVDPVRQRVDGLRKARIGAKAGSLNSR
jgi:hypothetical protein